MGDKLDLFLVLGLNGVFNFMDQVMGFLYAQLGIHLDMEVNIYLIDIAPGPDLMNPLYLVKGHDKAKDLLPIQGLAIHEDPTIFLEDFIGGMKNKTRYHKRCQRVNPNGHPKF